MATVVIPERTLYRRMEANLLASWERYADGSTDARVERLPGAAVAVFPVAPERDVYNNALLARDLDPPAASRAITAIGEAYSRAGVTRYAVWAHASEPASIAELKRRGYHVDTWTRAMAMPLDAVRAPHPEPELGAGEWDDYLAILTDLGAPEGVLAGVDGRAFEVLVATFEGAPVAAALAYDHDGDCGIYNVGTMPDARRRGLATALTSLHLDRARERGCTTASLQATAMAQRLYANLGFSDLGCFIEYVP